MWNSRETIKMFCICVSSIVLYVLGIWKAIEIVTWFLTHVKNHVIGGL